MRAWYSPPAALLVAGLLLGTGAEAQTTERVSIASDGSEGNGLSFAAAISADGRFVAFDSSADNLVPDDTNASRDIFVHDRDTGLTERVSLASDGTEGNHHSFQPSIAANGRFVAFSSTANNLVTGDTNARSDIYVHDRETGTTERVNIASDGTEAIDSSQFARISADGRFVTFRSTASNLVAGDTNDKDDVFVHDRDLGITELVSVASDGTEANNGSGGPAISADGRFVAFASDASNLVEGDTNDASEIFVRDRETRLTERVSVASDGTQADNGSHHADISADGRFVVFASVASNLVAEDTNGWEDVFVHDRVTGTTERVSLASDGSDANSFSSWSAISADGRFVAFSSNASNLVAGDTNDQTDGFVRDRVTGTTERINVANDGSQVNSRFGFLGDSVISVDGRFVAFHSEASSLVEGDTNDASDVFVRDRGAPPQLVIAGACPGGVSLSLTGATPESPVAFGWGTTEGSVTLPPGPCAGTKIGLADPKLLIILTADLAGAISLDRTVGGGVCGRLLQALDVATCTPSNVAGLP